MDAVNWVARTKPPRARAVNIRARGVDARNRPGTAVSTATSNAVATRMVRKPNLRISIGAMGREISAPTAMPVISRPAFSALQPSAICINSGIRNGVAPMPMRIRVPPVTLARKLR